MFMLAAVSRRTSSIVRALSTASQGKLSMCTSIHQDRPAWQRVVCRSSDEVAWMPRNCEKNGETGAPTFGGAPWASKKIMESKTWRNGNTGKRRNTTPWATTASFALLPQKEADNLSGFSPFLRVHGVELCPPSPDSSAPANKKAINSVNYTQRAPPLTSQGIAWFKVRPKIHPLGALPRPPASTHTAACNWTRENIKHRKGKEKKKENGWVRHAGQLTWRARPRDSHTEGSQLQNGPSRRFSPNGMYIYRRYFVAGPAPSPRDMGIFLSPD